MADVTSQTYIHAGLEELKQKTEELVLQNVIASKKSYENMMIPKFLFKYTIFYIYISQNK